MVSPLPDMRGGEPRVTVCAARDGGDRDGQTVEGEAPSACTYVYTTEFGWLIPPTTKARRRSVIDTEWLREFSSDIDIFRSEIRKQAKFVNVNEKLNCHEKCVRTTKRKCHVTMLKHGHKDRTCAMTTSSLESFTSSVRTRDLDSKDVTGKELHGGEATKGRDCYLDEEPSKAKTHIWAQDSESLVSEKSYALNSIFNMYTDGAKFDDYSSMQSDISRDSGMFSTDDTSLVFETPADKSLLQEFRDVLGYQDTSLESSIHCGSLPLEEAMLDGKEKDDCPAWLSRFSSSNCLSPEWGSQEISPFSCISPVTRGKSYSLKDDDSHCTSDDSIDHAPSPAVMSRKEDIWLKARQYKACGKESLLTHSPLQQISELSKLVAFFENLSVRVGELRSGMKYLAGEVKETKRDLVSLEEKTTQLLASTVSSRHRMGQFRALNALEDRLQEEWWAAYDPNTPSPNKNYIV